MYTKMCALGHRFPVFASWASAQVARQSFTKAESSSDVLFCAYTIEEVWKKRHLDCYYAHARHEREDSAPII